MTQTLLHFDGCDIKHERDSPRLTTQLERIKAVMLRGGWWTYKSIADITGDPENSISAQIRNLRKPRMGGWTTERRYIGDGLYEYRLDPESGNVNQ